jgi:hypothetical protein
VVGVQGDLQVHSRTDKFYYWDGQRYRIGEQRTTGSLVKTSDAQQKRQLGNVDAASVQTNKDAAELI